VLAAEKRRKVEGTGEGGRDKHGEAVAAGGRAVAISETAAYIPEGEETAALFWGTGSM
jgi:hypothetical protein